VVSRKYTLTVPDDQVEKIEQWKSRLNLSEVFRNAVERKIGALEAHEAKKEEDMEAIIERLRSERREGVGTAKEAGRAEGLSWAKNAHFENLRYAADTFDLVPDGTNYVFEGTLLNDPVLSEYFKEVLNRPPYQLEGRDRWDSLGQMEDAWIDGWKEAVDEFWGTVSERLDA